jgi:hypothetical protein
MTVPTLAALDSKLAAHATPTDVEDAAVAFTLEVAQRLKTEAR